jgi:hypothetical protein
MSDSDSSWLVLAGVLLAAVAVGQDWLGLVRSGNVLSCVLGQCQCGQTGGSCVRLHVSQH